MIRNHVLQTKSGLRRQQNMKNQFISLPRKLFGLRRWKVNPKLKPLVEIPQITQGTRKRIFSWPCSLPTLLIMFQIFFFTITTAVIPPPPFISPWRRALPVDILPSEAPTSRTVMWWCPIPSTSHFILIKNHIITIWPSPSSLFVGLCSSVLSFLLQVRDSPKATALLSTLGIGLFSPCIRQARYLFTT